MKHSLRLSPAFRRWMSLLLPPLAALLEVAAFVLLWQPALKTGNSVMLFPPSVPNEYWRAPTTQIGMPEGPLGTEITPEGNLYTGYHELYLLYGHNGEPGQICAKTLMGDALPIVRCHQISDGLPYTLESFGTSLDGRKEGPLVNLLSVTVSNPYGWKRNAYLVAGFRYRGKGVYYPKRPRVRFNSRWIYRFHRDAVLRGGQVLGLMPEEASRREGFPGQQFAQENEDLLPDESFEFRGTEAHIQPNSPVMQSIYQAELPPYSQHRWVFKIPTPPLPGESLPALRRLDFDREKQKVIRLWNGILDHSATFSVPDAKLTGLACASLANLYIGLDTQGRWLVPRVNELQYDGFYLRDGAFMIRALDLMGQTPEAERCLEYILFRQKPDGQFQSQAGQLDGWGQALWALGQHAALAGDEEFGRRIFPAVVRAVAWLERTRAATKQGVGPGAGLLPPGDPRDNEQVAGHLFGNDFWAYRGLSEAIRLAEWLGRTSEAKVWGRELSDYRGAIFSALRAATARTGGYIPPALEPGGYDWGNLEAAFSGALPPDHPWVQATMQHARSRFTEGQMTYGDRDTIHGYLGFNVPMAELRESSENARRAALETLLSSAAHTTAANGGYEYGSARRRDYGKNLSPHGCWAAKYLALLRDSLIREDGDTLHIGSLLSPVWVTPGKAVQVKNAPTHFGPVSYTLAGQNGGAVLNLDLPKQRIGHRTLRKIVFHGPVEAQLLNATSAHNGVMIQGNNAIFPPDVRTVQLTWKLPPNTAAWTMEAYMKRYDLPPVVFR